jgi:hypothetical protein
MSDQVEVDPLDDALAEVEAMRTVLVVLKPLSPDERARVLAMAAIQFGDYDIAISALQRAKAHL